MLTQVGCVTGADEGGTGCNKGLQGKRCDEYALLKVN